MLYLLFLCVGYLRLVHFCLCVVRLIQFSICVLVFEYVRLQFRLVLCLCLCVVRLCCSVFFLVCASFVPSASASASLGVKFRGE